MRQKETLQLSLSLSVMLCSTTQIENALLIGRDSWPMRSAVSIATIRLTLSITSLNDEKFNAKEILMTQHQSLSFDLHFWLKGDKTGAEETLQPKQTNTQQIVFKPELQLQGPRLEMNYWQP